MLVLIQVFWMLLVFGSVDPINGGVDEAQFRKSSGTSSVPMAGKPIKIPPKKV